MSGKNKTFFFFNYGGYRTFQSETVDLTVPTAEDAQRRFRRTADRPLRAPVLRRPRPDFRPDRSRSAARTAIPGNRLDQYLGGARISSIGRNFVNLFPLPNQTGPNGSTVFRNFRAQHDGHLEDGLLRDEDHAQPHRPAVAQLQLHVPQAAERQGWLPALPRALRRAGRLGPVVQVLLRARCSTTGR